MQAFFWAVVRAFTKLGIAIAASKPMIATTIMISTSVKPDLRFVLIRIFTLLLSFYARVNMQADGLFITPFVSFTYCRLASDMLTHLATRMPLSFPIKIAAFRGPQAVKLLPKEKVSRYSRQNLIQSGRSLSLLSQPPHSLTSTPSHLRQMPFHAQSE